MDKQQIIFADLGLMDYQAAWDHQEKLLQENVRKKSLVLSRSKDSHGPGASAQTLTTDDSQLTTQHHLLFVEHPPVYTLGKSGNKENVLLNDTELKEKEIQFFHTNRGGDITFHGAGQIVGYPILDLEKFDTDIGKYLRRLEDVIILTLADYGIKAERSAGETGVWIEPGVPGKERKICAIGVRCSRWVTMHGFAFNVNTDLSYFDHIIPCGISNKQVTSLEKETGMKKDLGEVKERVKQNFERVFNVEIKDKSE
ncbi:MAG TPA: lipoyl(octanoyl) transferase LipB [Chitinophagaceae bacterium]|nr:lipoyl(octanoyl) transferase LipB [Chitinophagaceae bacterium]